MGEQAHGRADKYIYCIAATAGSAEFGAVGIDEPRQRVYGLPHLQVSAIISDASALEYSISRENLLAHQRVMESAMREHAILPVRFSTVAQGGNGVSAEDLIRTQVLEPHYADLQDALSRFETTVEISVKALWRDTQAIFAEISRKDDEVRRMKERIAGKPAAGTYHERIVLGERVKKLLEARRDRDAGKLIERLAPLAVESRQNGLTTEAMVANGAFLVEKANLERVRQTAAALREEVRETMFVKCAGPLPPSNFVEITIDWGPSGSEVPKHGLSYR